jgi:hypothetical protein
MHDPLYLCKNKWVEHCSESLACQLGSVPSPIRQAQGRLFGTLLQGLVGLCLDRTPAGTR